MHYKTMVLALLEQHPRRYDLLRRKRPLITWLDRYSRDLRASHEAWKESLLRSRPGSDAHQIASEALEIALKELADQLGAEFPAE